MADRRGFRGTLRRLAAEQRGQSAGTQGKVIPRGYDPSTIIVRNESGEDLGKFAPVGIDFPVFAPSKAEGADKFMEYPAVAGVAPSVLEHAGRFVVLLEPIPKADASGNLSTGRAAIMGVVPVRVYVNSLEDQHVDVIIGKTVDGEMCRLGTGASGAQILWLEEAAEKDKIFWAIVRLGIPKGCRFGVVKEKLSAGGSAKAYFRKRNSGDTGYETTTVEFKVYAAGNWPDDFSIEAGTRFKIDYDEDPQWPHPVATEPTCSPAETVT